MSQGFNKVQLTNPKQILFMTNPYAAVGVVVTNTGMTADADGNKIIKAGTPLVGDLTARNTAFTRVKTGSEGNEASVVGVALHDVDVTNSDANAELLITGYVNLDNLDNDTVSLINANVKSALKGSVYFLK